MIVATLYVLHMIAYPAGWAPPQWSNADFTRPSVATMGENGAVAVILARWTSRYAGRNRIADVPSRIFVQRADGTATSLYAIDALQATRPFRMGNDATPCLRKDDDCPEFTSVTLARDGTPFATLTQIATGAIMLTLEASVKWNGAWQVVPPARPFDRAGDPHTPSNVSVGAADTPQDYAYSGDFGDSFGMDSDIARQRRSYWHAIAAVRIGPRTTQLGLGSVTAMRGAFVAGEDTGNVTGNGTAAPSYAVLWRCLSSIAAVNPCARRTLGLGIPYGVDSRGDVVGGDSVGDGELMNNGRPVLWRAAGWAPLSDRYGAAYAISESGVIVGSFGGKRAYNGVVYGPFSGFVADARSPHPKAVALDGLVRNLGPRHIEAAFGVADSGRILVYVVPTNVQHPQEHKQLAILVPQ